jgi:hypothetical protein
LQFRSSVAISRHRLPSGTSCSGGVAEEGGCRDSCFGGPSTMVCVAEYLQRRQQQGSGAEGADRWGGREGVLCRRGAPPGALRRRGRARRWRRRIDRSTPLRIYVMYYVKYSIYPLASP